MIFVDNNLCGYGNLARVEYDKMFVQNLEGSAPA
jgi:hypothetical protein